MKRMCYIFFIVGFIYGQVDYDQVQTIFDNNCISCHQNGGAYQGGLDLTSYANVMAGDSDNGPAVVPEDHANSPLWQKVQSGDMPPSGNLTSDEVDLIADWIDEGALEQVPVDVTGLFFSEYAEGSSYNKYLEIYNGTGSDVDLSGLAFANTSNDPGTVGEYEFWTSFTDGATVAAGDVYVIAHPDADEYILGFADQTHLYLSNGDDGYCLVEGTEDSYTIVDCIGDWNGDPGSGWDVAGVENATADHTLVRKASVTEGNASWTESAGTDASDSEWLVLDQNTWDYLGSHPHSMNEPSIVIDSPEDGETLFSSELTVEFSVSNFSVGEPDDADADGHIHYSLNGADPVMYYSVSSITLTDLPLGNHTFVMWLVDNSHASLDPVVSDTVNFTLSESTITSIYDIQYVEDPDADDTSPLDGQVVTVRGVVTAEPLGSINKRNMVFQDAEGPWNGIQVYYYDGWDNFDWVDSNGNPHPAPAEGDEIELTGTVEEYVTGGTTSMTQLGDFSSGIVFGPALEMISPDTISVGAIGEAYESCLITVEDVYVSDPDLGYGEWGFTDGVDSSRADDIWNYFYFPDSLQELKSITGTLYQNYGNYKIEPRLARDVVEEGTVRIQRVQQVLHSDLMKATVDGVSDTSYMLNETVTLEGVVTMPTGLSYAGDGVKFIFADKNGGPWSAILSYDPDSSAFPNLFEGDLIQATGYVYEYNTVDANMTELFITEPINIIDFEQPLPVVELVNTGDLRSQTTAEQWGTVMVSVEDAIVTENELEYDVMKIDDGSGPVLVQADSDSIQDYFSVPGSIPPVGSMVQSMEGWVYHHYGSLADSSTYNLCPLYVEDMQFGAGPPTISSLSREPCAPTSSDSEVSVSCVIMDNSTITEALLHYSIGGAEYVSSTMTTDDDSVYTAVIPISGVTDVVNYYVTATDDGLDQSEPKTSHFPSDIEYDQLGFGVVDVLNTTDLQETLWPSGNTRYEGCIVTVSGIVTADTAQYNSSYSSYALSEGFPGQWSGLVFDTEEMVDVTRGDHVTVTGLVTDYDPDWPFQLYGNTRLINAEVTVDSQVEVPAPTLVTCAELAQTADEVESYEGVLVSLNDVTISSVNSYDWSITDETGFEALIDDDMLNFRDSLLMDNLVEGQQLSHVMGIFNYSFGTYKVQIRDAADLGQMVGVDDDVKVNPYEYALHDNFPNPFNPETQIRFSLGGQEDVKLMIYDITGRQVRTLVNGNTHDAGFHVVHWNGLDNSGQKVPSGMYIYRIKAGNFIADKKMLLVK